MNSIATAFNRNQQITNTMNRSEKKIVRKAINICKSVKNAIGKFAYDYDEDYEFDEDEDNEDDCYLGDQFLDVIAAQKERLDNLFVDLSDFLEDYSGEYEEEISQAQMSIDLASGELSYIETNFSTWDGESTFYGEISNAVEYLEEAIEYLEGCNDDIF